MRPEHRLERLYDQLSRYHWWRRTFSRAKPGAGLEMRKRLRRPSDLNTWIWEAVEPAAHAAVLDIGCGFGATLFECARRGAAACVGLTLSRYQVGKASAEARRLGLDDVCRFRRQSFDTPIADPFDLVVSVESLFHAADLAATLRNLAACTRPGGTLVLVEDMAVDAAVREQDASRQLLDRWSTTAMHTVADYRDGLQSAGFDVRRELDFTDQIELATSEDRRRRSRRLARLRRFAPVGRQVVDAFLGGVAMEELHDAGLLRYRALIAVRR